MVLHAERLVCRRFEAFARAVVQVHVRRLRDAFERIEVDDETVILRGDLDATGGKILDRLIQTTVAELELVTAAAERARQQLMPEANSKNRLLAKQILDGLDGM